MAEIKIGQLCELAKDLVLEHGIKQSEIYKHIRQALQEEAEKLPKTLVAYNATYGGYGYSDLFEEYISLDRFPERNNDCSDSHRTQVVPHILAFGCNMSTTYSYIARLVSRYICYDLKNVFTHVYSLINYERELSNVLANRDLIKSVPQNAFGTSLAQWYDVHIKNMRYNNYTKKSLEDAANESIPYLQNKIDNEKKAINMPKDILDLMVSSYNYKYPEEKSAARHDYRHPDKNGKRLDFPQAVEHYKHTPTPWAIWKCQAHVNEHAMRFLMENPLVLPALHPYVHENDEDYMLMGLLFASGAYSKIEIASMPQLLDWRISEYDGFESVTIV